MESPRTHRTLLIEALLQIDDDAEALQYDPMEQRTPFSITAYYLTNSGQGAELDIYHLPCELIGFLADMQKARFRHGWNEIVKRAWETTTQKKRPGNAAPPAKPRRNWLYEDLFALPGNARAFLRTYFLRQTLSRFKDAGSDPRTTYSTMGEADLVSWAITERFLRRIMSMNQQRIEEIRAMGDQLADYVSSRNDRRFFRIFYTTHHYDHFRTALIKADLAQVRSGNCPIMAFDSYIRVFEEGDEMARPDWKLARDLVLIRMIERLHSQGWISRNADAIQEEESEQESP